MIFYISKTYNPVFVKNKKKKLRIVRSKILLSRMARKFQFFTNALDSIRSDFLLSISPVNAPVSAICANISNARSTRKKKREKKRKRWSNPTIPSLRTIWISPFEAGFSSTWNNEGRRKRERESEYIKRIDITRGGRPTERALRVGYRVEGISVPLRVVSQPSLTGNRVKCVARLFVRAPPLCRPVHRRVCERIIIAPWSLVNFRRSNDSRDFHRDPNFRYERDPS